MTVPILTIEEVREYVSDRAPNNLLLDKEEFSSSLISLSMDLAISDYNMIPPFSSVSLGTFPSKGLLMHGTLYYLFTGQSALLARNQMSYTDGGLQIPIEERYGLYQQMGAMHQAAFQDGAAKLKAHLNLEEGWGGVVSDFWTMPVW